MEHDETIEFQGKDKYYDPNCNQKKLQASPRL